MTQTQLIYSLVFAAVLLFGGYVWRRIQRTKRELEEADKYRRALDSLRAEAYRQAEGDNDDDRAPTEHGG